MASGPPSVSSSKETTNYARLCRVLVEVGSQALRDTLDSIHPPGNLHTVLSRNKPVLQSLRKKRIINPLQWNKLFPAIPPSVTSGNFDITLTVVLLRNICGLTPPATGWDQLPSPGGTSREADISRVKYFRNNIYGHAEQASVDDVTFNKCWLDIRDTLVRLVGTAYGAAIDTLETECMDPEVEDHYKQLLQQWKKDDDNVKDKLSDMETEIKKVHQEVEDLKATVAPPPRIDPTDLSEEAYFPTEIVEAIRQRYSEEKLQLPPWCKEFNFCLKDLSTFTKEGPSNLLVRISRSKRKALILGKAGIGKTVHCLKLAYDWAVKQNEFHKFLPETQVLLLLNCCDISSDIWKAIDEQLLPGNIDEESKEKFFAFIRENQFKVMFILDGLDKSPPDLPDMVSQLVETELPQCRYVFTAESAKLAMTDKLKMRHDCQLGIAGFTKEDVKNFINNHFDDQKILAQNLNDAIDKSEFLQKIATGNPIYTALLCLLCKDRKGDIPSSKAQLCMEMVLCAVRRYDFEKGGSSSDEELMVTYKDQLTRIGLIDFNFPRKGDVDFEREEVAFSVKDLPEYGFMSAQSSGCVRRPRLWYAFRNFFAGFYLASQIVSGEIDLKAVIADEYYREGGFFSASNFFGQTEIFVFMSGILELQSEEKALDLVRNICLQINSAARAVNTLASLKTRSILLLALECREDANRRKDNLSSKLTSMLGSNISLEKLSLADVNFHVENTLLDGGIPDPRYFYYRSSVVNSIRAHHVTPFSEVIAANTTVTTLHLIGNRELIDDEGAIALSEALKVNRSLTNLDLSRNAIGSSGIQALSTALKINSTLTTLDLSENKIDFTCVHFLSEALVVNSSLSSLNLKWNGFAGSACPLPDKLRTKWFLIFPNMPSPEELQTFDDQEVVDAYKGPYSLFESLKKNSTLSNLNLGLNDLNSVGAYYLAESLKVNTSLTALDLQENRIGRIGAKCLSAALKMNSSLAFLNVARNDICGPGIEVLSESLEVNSTLTCLDLAHNKIRSSDSEFLAEALSFNDTLTSLNLSRNKIDALGAQSLSKALQFNTTLSTINLEGNPSIGGAGFQFLSECLQSNFTLSSLNLSHNGIEKRGVSELVNALIGNKTLSNLNLSRNNIPWPELAGFLKVNSTLKTLTLCENVMRYSDSEVLFEAIGINKALNELNFSRMSAFEVTAGAILEALKGNTALALLDLSENGHRFGDIAPSIFKGLEHNTTLTRLELYSNRIEDSDCPSISESLKINAGLKYLVLSGNYMTEVGLKSIVEALKHNSTLRYLDISNCNNFHQMRRSWEEEVASRKDFEKFVEGTGMSDLRIVL